MLFHTRYKKVMTWRNFFGLKRTEETITEVLYSAKDVETFHAYMKECHKSKGSDGFVGLFRTVYRNWTKDYTWKILEGDDTDAHILILESPTGVLYDFQRRWI